MGWGLLTRLVLATLATYRMAQLVSLDDGPLDLFAHLRGLTCYDHNGKARTGKGWESLSKLVNCPYCLGVWFGALFTVATMFSVSFDLWTALVFWLAIAGGQSALQAIADR